MNNYTSLQIAVMQGNHVKKRVSTHLLNINFYMRNYRNYILYLVTL